MRPRVSGDAQNAAFEGRVVKCHVALDAAFSGKPCQVVREDGTTRLLPTPLWAAQSTATDDALFVDPCHGATLDVGCGPGRLTEALASRGIEVLGIDTSEEAVRLTRARGAMALQRDVYDPIPHYTGWSHVILADGNIGLGGDPLRLLRRVRQLLHDNGTALVEVAGRGVKSEIEQLRLQVGDSISVPFRWSVVGADDIEHVAAHAGLNVMGLRTRDERTVATLRPRTV